MSLNFGKRPDNKGTVLLLTGTIKVNLSGATSSAISNPEKRLSQYLYGISYAIDNYHLVKKIVFCENSNYDYDYTSLIRKAGSKGKEFEVLTFQGNYPVIRQKGKGYGEGEAIEYALNNSKLLKDSISFYKLTGRLAIGNMDQLIAATTAENGFIWHPKEIYQRKADHVETYFFKTGKTFYMEKLLDAYRGVDETNHLYIEHLFYERLKRLKIRAFKYPLQIIGNSGTSGKPYLESRNAVRLERICCIAGAHHLHKNATERIQSVLLAWSIQFRTKWKRLL